MRSGITMSERPVVWLDMDPGIDDSWAMVVAMSQCAVRGISTVAGNVPLEQTYGNAHQVLDVLEASHLPVVPGADGPLLEPLITAKAFHGEGGLGEWEGNSRTVEAEAVRVWSWWGRHIEAGDNIHLIATGPLTNVALGLLAFPDLSKKWASITCMCGALPGAKIDKAQEFNVYVDPHAADVVFRWGVHVQLIGITVAHRALVPVMAVERLLPYGKVGRMLHAMMGFYSERSRGEGGDPGAFPIDDVVAVAAVAAPELFQWQEMPLTVVREGPLRGTVVISPIDVKRPSVRVAVDVDAVKFLKWLWNSMERYRK